jgi:hypothetical protein
VLVREAEGQIGEDKTVEELRLFVCGEIWLRLGLLDGVGEHGVIAAGAGQHDGEADGGEHEEDGGPGSELGEEVGRAPGAEGGLRSLAAEGAGEIGGFALLDEDDADEEEADDDVEGDEEVDHGRASGPLRSELLGVGSNWVPHAHQNCLKCITGVAEAQRR